MFSQANFFLYNLLSNMLSVRITIRHKLNKSILAKQRKGVKELEEVWTNKPKADDDPISISLQKNLIFSP